MKVSLRELDALVAERVMGRVLPTQEQMIAEAERVWYDQPSAVSFHTLGGFTAYRRNSGAVVCASAVPDYSKDHNAAFEVVARMQKDDWLLTLHRYSDFATASFWRTEETNEVERNAETAPIAICLAALATKGIHVEIEDA